MKIALLIAALIGISQAFFFPTTGNGCGCPMPPPPPPCNCPPQPNCLGCGFKPLDNLFAFPMPTFTFPPLRPSYQTGPEPAYNIPPSVYESHQSPSPPAQPASPLQQTPPPPPAAEPAVLPSVTLERH